jgi:hypothetical protein
MTKDKAVIAKRRRGRRIAPDILDRIAELADKGIAATEIYKDLQGDERYADRLPDSVRTIQSVVRDLTPHLALEERWSVVEASPQEAAAVLPVLASVISESGGRRQWLTRAEAQWIAKLRVVASDLVPFDTYRLARLYLLRLERGETTDDLDGAVAFAPWRSEENDEAYRRAIGAAWVPPLRTNFFLASRLGAQGIEGIGVVYQERREDRSDAPGPQEDEHDQTRQR